jgi:hypothetical protein
MRWHCIYAIAALCGALPWECRPHSRIAVNDHFELLQNTDLCGMAVDGFARVVDDFAAVGADSGDLFGRLLAEAEIQTNMSLLASLFGTIGRLFLPFLFPLFRPDRAPPLSNPVRDSRGLL